MNLNLEVNKEVIEDFRDVDLLAKFFKDEFKKLESLQSNIIWPSEGPGNPDEAPRNRA